jgi:hypothetical protein
MVASTTRSATWPQRLGSPVQLRIRRYAALLAAPTVLVGGAAYSELEQGQFHGRGQVLGADHDHDSRLRRPLTRDDRGPLSREAVMLVGIGLIAVLTGAVAELPRRGSAA